jgi:hypothetical protein
MVTRAVLASTLLAALFLMHGPSAVEGCPGGQPMSVSGAMSDSTVANHVAAAIKRDTVTRQSVTTVGDTASAGGGQVCVSRPPRLAPIGPLALTLLVAIIGLAVWAGRAYFLDSDAGRRRRAPPAGRPLLQILCVSRT